MSAAEQWLTEIAGAELKSNRTAVRFLVRAQESDPELRDVMRRVRSKELEGGIPEARSVAKVAKAYLDADEAEYQIGTDGLLVRISSTDKEEAAQARTQVVIPRSLRKQLLQYAHNSTICGGHFGVAKTYLNLRLHENGRTIRM